MIAIFTAVVSWTFLWVSFTDSIQSGIIASSVVSGLLILYVLMFHEPKHPE